MKCHQSRAISHLFSQLLKWGKAQMSSECGRKRLHYRDRREGYHQLPLPSFLPSFLASPPRAPERLRATLCGRAKSSSGPVSGAVNAVRCIEVQWQPRARAVGPRHDEWDSAVNIHSACLTHDGWRSLPSSLTPSLAQGAKKEGAEERRAKASKYKDKRQINIMTNVNCNAAIIAPRLRIQDDCD